MAITLTEAARLSNDVLLQGVIETIIKESPLLQEMPFIEIVGNALSYNRELALPSAEWHGVNDDWVTSPAITFTPCTATLKILGQNADVDNYIRSTRSNIQDIEAAVIELTSKAIRHELEDKFIYGDDAADANQFDGLVKIIDTTTDPATPNPQVVSMATAQAGATLTLSKIDELIDRVKGGKPAMLMMSRRSRRKINALARAAGSNLEVGQGKLGDFVQLYNGIPITINDFMLDTHRLAADPYDYEDSLTAGSCASIYAFQLGEGALVGVTGPGGLTVEHLGSMETKDAQRTRIKWYVSLALFSNVKAAALIGIKND